MDNPQERPSDLELGWLIGAIEGEGCLHVSRSKWRNGKLYHNVLVTVCNSQRAFVEKLAAILTKGGVGHHVRWFTAEVLNSYKHPNFPRRAKRDQGHITIWGVRRVTQLLDLVGDKWSGKAGQAQVLREFCELSRPYVGPKVEALRERCHRLNKGIPTGHTQGTLRREDMVEAAA